MVAETNLWSSDVVCLYPREGEAKAIASEIYQRTCRVDFLSPGFCTVDLGETIESQTFRQLMVDVKNAMALLHREAYGNTLNYLSAARFDQQETTRPHLDGGPDECFLMLGYEPTDVDSEIEIADYSKCAFEMGITPQEFMEKHNPMFMSGYELLRPYSTRIPCFAKKAYQLICINNSSAPFNKTSPAWQGVLHTATIATPDESKRRVINSTMIASVPVGTPEIISAEEQSQFVSTTAVRRRGYDKLQLEEDLG